MQGHAEDSIVMYWMLIIGSLLLHIGIFLVIHWRNIIGENKPQYWRSVIGKHWRSVIGEVLLEKCYWREVLLVVFDCALLETCLG